MRDLEENDLRKAAEMALKALENMSPETDTLVEVAPHVWEYRGNLAINALRQALTPEVTPEVPCKTDPRAPHGFDRNASHSADRYVCECEGWEPPRRQWVGLTDEEVKYLTSHFDWRAPKEQFVPVIEARLKEKNT
jgi:hypothetical protein